MLKIKGPSIRGAGHTCRSSRGTKGGRKTSTKVTPTDWIHLCYINIDVLYTPHEFPLCIMLQAREKEVTASVKNVICHLVDRRDGVAAGRLSQRQGDGLFVATFYSCQTQKEMCSLVGPEDNEAHPKRSTALLKLAA